MDQNITKGKRKRKTKLRKPSESASTSTSTPLVPIKSDVFQGELENIKNLKSLSSSILPPLTGTPQAAKAKLEEKSGIQRYLNDLLKPAPKGEEPQAIKLVKTITWFAVICLVLVEIYVSIKTGGTPFEIGKTKLPERPAWMSLDEMSGLE